ARSGLGAVDALGEAARDIPGQEALLAVGDAECGLPDAARAQRRLQIVARRVCVIGAPFGVGGGKGAGGFAWIPHTGRARLGGNAGRLRKGFRLELARALERGVDLAVVGATQIAKSAKQVRRLRRLVLVVAPSLRGCSGANSVLHAEIGRR